MRFFFSVMVMDYKLPHVSGSNKNSKTETGCHIEIGGENSRFSYFIILNIFLCLILPRF